MTVIQLLPGRQQFVRDDCDGLGAADVLATTGITYRQLDFWSRTRRVTCHHHIGDKVVQGRGGSGSNACWSLSQVHIMQRVRALLGRGLDLEHAFVLATNPQAVAALLAELTYIQADLIEEEEQ